MNGTKIVKIVFKEYTNDRPKVVFGTILNDADGFLEVKATDGNTLTINKQHIIFTKGGCY
jgi:hypothetical protein